LRIEIDRFKICYKRTEMKLNLFDSVSYFFLGLNWQLISAQIKNQDSNFYRFALLALLIFDLFIRLSLLKYEKHFEIFCFCRICNFNKCFNAG